MSPEICCGLPRRGGAGRGEVPAVHRAFEDGKSKRMYYCLVDNVCGWMDVGGGSADSEIGFEFEDEHGGHFQALGAPYAEHFCVEAGDVFDHPTASPTASSAPTISAASSTAPSAAASGAPRRRARCDPSSARATARRAPRRPRRRRRARARTAAPRARGATPRARPPTRRAARAPRHPPLPCPRRPPNSNPGRRRWKPRSPDSGRPLLYLSTPGRPGTPGRTGAPRRTPAVSRRASRRAS